MFRVFLEPFWVTFLGFLGSSLGQLGIVFGGTFGDVHLVSFWGLSRVFYGFFDVVCWSWGHWRNILKANSTLREEQY